MNMTQGTFCQCRRSNIFRASSSVVLALILSWCLCVSSAIAQSSSRDSLSPDELKKRSLEELMAIDITSVLKRSEPLFEAAASVYVITSDDIRRSGARSLAGVLRLAPNLEVAQVDSRQWAISVRGFNNTTANKLLVTIDGRSVS